LTGRLRGLRHTMPVVDGSCDGWRCEHRNRHRNQQNRRPSRFI